MWQILDPKCYGFIKHIIYPAKKYKCIGVRGPMYNMKGESHNELLARRADIIARVVGNGKPCMIRAEFYGLPTAPCDERWRLSKEEGNQGAVIHKDDEGQNWLTIYNLV